MQQWLALITLRLSRLLLMKMPMSYSNSNQLMESDTYSHEYHMNNIKFVEHWIWTNMKIYKIIFAKTFHLIRTCWWNYIIVKYFIYLYYLVVVFIKQKKSFHGFYKASEFNSMARSLSTTEWTKERISCYS